MTPDDFALKLARSDSAAEREFMRIADADAAFCAEVSQAFFSCDAANDRPATCVLVMRGYVKASGRKAVEEWLVSHWPLLSGPLRQKVVYCASDSAAMSTEFAESLFNHESSRVDDRHLIVAGLASSAKQRKSKDLVLRLLPQVGRYDNASKQQILASFTKKATKHFQ